MIKKTLQELSKKVWVSSCNNDSATLEELKLGALLRIADASEKMATRYAELIDERDRFERSARSWRQACERKSRSNSALLGYITKLKKAKGGAA